MIYIAHRALFDGPNPDRENHPDQIKLALALGFDAEIDVRYIDGHWYLGHDEPTYQVTDDFFLEPGLWIHCKNREALANIETSQSYWYRSDFIPNYFWHQNDDFTLTSHNYIWTYPGQVVDTRRGITVQPEWKDRWFDDVYNIKGYGVCSKFVGDIRSMHLNAI